jgi:hypothetical protein
MRRFYLSLKRHQHVADITNRCLRHPRDERIETNPPVEAVGCIIGAGQDGKKEISICLI